MAQAMLDCVMDPAAPLDLLARLPDAAEAEITQIIAVAEGVRVERIVSLGQASPPGFWYDQGWAEWVLVLAGEALLRFEDDPAARRLGAGDALAIPAGRRHRVEWTDPDRPTIWLAVHYAPQLKG